eukprot:TRINITY_DN113_c0_g4_i1.p1 TRINITY_DN113_c0_g4~~TRINITY_DN113_c0_g4_i1.p1  ORF type:complete len:313 (+),score=-0.69 TRINITY_DN113_c0_g4_i1:41-979(+)
MQLVLAVLAFGECISLTSKLDTYGRSCQYYELRREDCGTGDNEDFIAAAYCCACKVTPSPTTSLGTPVPSTAQPGGSSSVSPSSSPTTPSERTPSPPSSDFRYVIYVIIGCVGVTLLCLVGLLCMYRYRVRAIRREQRPGFSAPFDTRTDFSLLVPVDQKDQVQHSPPPPVIPPLQLSLVRAPESPGCESPKHCEDTSDYLPLLSVPIDDRGRGSRRKLHRAASFSVSDRGFIAHSPATPPPLPPSDTVINNPIEPLEPRSTSPVSQSSTYSPVSTKKSLYLAKPASMYTPRPSPHQDDMPPMFRSRSPVKI